MSDLRCALLSDGSSDRALMPVLLWLLRQKLPRRPIQLEWADLGKLRPSPKGLVERIQAAGENYPSDLLFVHRDAEGELREKRLQEIHDALQLAECDLPSVCVIPVRMQEAWMLVEEQAIRHAAGNPNGTISLDLPRIQDLESVNDPKTTLHELLRIACELGGRRLRKFAASTKALRVAEFIENWQPLRHLSAFVELERELDGVLSRMSLT